MQRKRSKFIFAALTTALIISTTLGIYVKGAEEDYVHDFETDVLIGFEPGEEPVSPVNPDEPDEETGEPGTQQPGPLSLDWAPILEFGETHSITGLEHNFYATTTKPYIQVSDLRGTGTGWRVTAALQPFQNQYGDSLPSAYIVLRNGRPNTATTGIEAPDPVNPVMLDSDSTPAKVVSAAADKKAGRGTWVVRWYPTVGTKNTDVELILPAASIEVGTHTSSILWTLYDAP